MHIDVAFTAGGADADQIEGRLVCVIDVLRASSTIVEALAAGAVAVWPVAEVEAARRQRDRLIAAGYAAVLAGERDAEPPPGFDLGNSPRDCRPEIVGGKHLVLTTTNGTKALVQAVRSGARGVLVAALTNLYAVVDRLLRDEFPHAGANAGTHESQQSEDARAARDVLLYAAGTEGRVSLEDTVCAGLIARELSLRMPAVELSDAARVAIQTYVSSAAAWPKALLKGRHAQTLSRKGFRADVDWCLRIGTVQSVGVWREDRIINDP